MSFAEFFLPAVMQILVTGGGCGTAGTGFFISPDGLVVTNKHVMACALQNPQAKVTFRIGFLEERSHYTVLTCGKGKGKDICVLRLPGYFPKRHFRLESQYPEDGSVLYVLGNGGNKGIRLKVGRFKGRLLHEGTSFLQHNAPAERGDSGSPVFTAQGKLVGVHSLLLISSYSGMAGKHLKGKVAHQNHCAVAAAEVDRLVSRFFESGAEELTPRAYFNRYGRDIDWGGDRPSSGP
jgi:S1-C subfamily serine protease